MHPDDTTRHCAYCGDPLAPDADPRQKYCSTRCRLRYYNNGHQPQRFKTCAHCGKPLDPRTQPRNKYCSVVCRSAENKRTPEQRREFSQHGSVILNCATCGKEIKTFPYRVKDGVKYCSFECRDIGRRKGEYRTCEQCGGTFYVSRSAMNRTAARYCSHTCEGNARRNGVPRTCEYCGKPFSADKWAVDQGFGRFCSHQCSGKAHRKRTSQERSSAQYNEWRQSVLERAAFTCQGCGTQGIPLYAHHIKWWKTYPELRFEVSNGIALCRACHGKEHQIFGGLY